MSFYLFYDQRMYFVTTETGSGLARVIVEEVNPPEPDSLEPSEEA